MGTPSTLGYDSKNDSVHSALVVVRDVALKIEAQLKLAGPPGENAQDNLVKVITSKHKTSDANKDDEQLQEKYIMQWLRLRTLTGIAYWKNSLRLCSPVCVNITSRKQLCWES